MLLKPKNLDEMLEIYGVGPIKLEKYGQQFLDVLKDYSTKNPRRRKEEEHQLRMLNIKFQLVKLMDMNRKVE